MKKTKTFFIFFLLCSFILSLFPVSSGFIGGSVTSNLRSDGTYLYMTMEDGVKPQCTITSGTTYSLDTTSKIEGQYSLRWNFTGTESSKTLTYYYNQIIKPTKWSIKFLMTEDSKNDIAIKVYDSLTGLLFSVDFYNDSGTKTIRLNSLATSLFLSGHPYELNTVYTITATNIDYTSDTTIVTVSNSTSSSSIATSFSTTNCIDIYELDIRSTTDDYFSVYIDDWTMGTQIDIADSVSHSNVNSSGATITGTLDNDGSTLQNNSQDNHSLKVLYDTVSHLTENVLHFDNHNITNMSSVNNIKDGDLETAWYATEGINGRFINYNHTNYTTQTGTIAKVYLCPFIGANILANPYITLKPFLNDSNTSGNLYKVYKADGALWTGAWWNNTIDITNMLSSWSWSNISNLHCNMTVQQIPGWITGILDVYIKILTTNETYPYNTTIPIGKYTGDTLTKTLAGLLPGKMYYYCIYGETNYTNSSSYSYSEENHFLTLPEAPKATTFGFLNSTAINLSWTKGTGANNTLIVYKTTGMPTSITDGTLLYNGTTNYTTLNIINDTSYYVRGWSYTSWTGPADHQFSTNYTDFNIGGLYINCFDENTLSNLTFNVSIINDDGSQVYNAYGCTNTKNINVTLCPQGLVNIYISASNHTNRTYYRTIQPNIFYTLNAYLPPTSQLYLISVVNELSQPLANVEVSIKRYINTTGIYETVSTTYTDGMGQTSVYLVPDTQYKVFLTKTGYNQSGSKDWIPDSLIYTKTFKMNSDPDAPQPPIIDLEDILFTGTLTSTTTAQVTYNDLTLGTHWATLTITMKDLATNLWYNIATYNYTTQTWTVTQTSLNRSNIYYFNLTFNHHDLGIHYRQYIVDRTITPPTNQSEADSVFDWVGVIPIGASNFFMWLFLIAGMYYADERDIGKITIILGVLFLVINAFIGWTSDIVGAFAGGIPLLFIVLGLLIEWGNARRRDIG